jgi:alpha-galactosidase
MSVQGIFDLNDWNRLSVKSAFYKQGFGTHANSQHIFYINRLFNRFTTDYGIDTGAESAGSAIFEIWGDGKLIWSSAKIIRDELPRHIEVDITGVKYLGLITTDAGDGNSGDHTDWLRPTLWP